MDNVPDTVDDADAPIIVPPRNQVLRRTARTKIRKPNLTGDGGGHRFPATRRKSAGRSNTVDVLVSPTDGSSSGHGEIEPSPIPPVPAPPVQARKRTLEVEELQDNRRFTYTDETSIFDAYAETQEDDRPPSPHAVTPVSSAGHEPTRVVVEPISTPSPPRPSITTEPTVSPSPQLLQPQPKPAPAPILHQPQPQGLSPQQQEAPQPPSRTP